MVVDNQTMSLAEREQGVARRAAPSRSPDALERGHYRITSRTTHRDGEREGAYLRWAFCAAVAMTGLLLAAPGFGIEPCSFVMYSDASRLGPVDMLKGARRRRKEGERHRGSVYHRAQVATVGESKVLMG